MHMINRLIILILVTTVSGGAHAVKCTNHDDTRKLSVTYGNGWAWGQLSDGNVFEGRIHFENDFKGTDLGLMWVGAVETRFTYVFRETSGHKGVGVLKLKDQPIEYFKCTS